MSADLPDELIERMTAHGLSVDDFDALDDEFQDAILSAYEVEQAGIEAADEVPGVHDDLPREFLDELAARGVTEAAFRAMPDEYREEAAAAWLEAQDSEDDDVVEAGTHATLIADLNRDERIHATIGGVVELEGGEDDE